MQCDRFLETLPLYLDDRLRGAERAAWRGHFQSCASCREAALRAEPSLLFLGSGREGPAEAEIDRHIRAALDAARTERLGRTIRSVRARQWAAAAVLALTAGAGWYAHLGRAPVDGKGGTPPAARVEHPVVEVEMDPGVTVYQFASESDETTTVAFVVDPEMRL